MCVSMFLFSFFFMKAILSFFDFWTIFFRFILALTFHKCQIVKKAFLSFFCSFLKWAFFGVFFLALGAGRRAAPFSVGLFVCVFVFSLLFGLFWFGFLLGSGCWAPRCSFFRWAFCVRFCVCFLFFWGFFGFLATTGRGGAEAYDSGLGAHYSGRRSL